MPRHAMPSVPCHAMAVAWPLQTGRVHIEDTMAIHQIIFPKQHVCCGCSLTKDVWRGSVVPGPAEISGIGYNTRRVVRGTGHRVQKGRAGGIAHNKRDNG